MDALAGKIAVNGSPSTQAEIRPCTNFQALILAEFRVSNRHVETVYRLAPLIPPVSEPAVPDEEVTAFIRERINAASTFTASLFITAWHKSEESRIPSRSLPKPAATTAPEATVESGPARAP
jgi:hypothetical protein